MTPRTVAEAASAMRSGQATSEALTAALLERIGRANPTLGAFVMTCDEQALLAAKRADEEFAAGVDRGALQGIPVAVKDIFATADAPTTAQSRALDESWGMGRDAAAVTHLRRAGCVILGKSSTSEFAIGLPEAEGPFPLPRNPWDLDCWAGGSSAGAASGVSAGLCLGGIGSDSGGSIRIPAAFCGVTGLKPTFGTVPREGCLRVSRSLDHVGPVARTAYDCALLLDALVPNDGMRTLPSDSWLHGDFKAWRIGVDRAHYARVPTVEPAAVEAFEAAVSRMSEAGAMLQDVTVANLDKLEAATSVILHSEAFDTHRRNLAARWHDYGPSTRLRIASGSFFTGADYSRAIDIHRAGLAAAADLFQRVDVLLMMTAGVGAWRLDDISLEAPIAAPFFTRAWNGLGLPALSIPIGFNADGLPLGMQIIGRAFEDATVLRVGAAYQAITDWHRRYPPSTWSSQQPPLALSAKPARGVAQS